jgi:hypothetical protein
MPKLSSLRVDVAAESEGRWFEYVPGLRFLIASTGSRTFRAAIDTAMQPYRDLIRQDQTNPGKERRFTVEMREKVVRRVMAERVLIGWDGLEADDGTPIPYSADEAERLLADAAMHRVTEWVERIAESEWSYLLQRAEADQKNSPGP